MSEYVFYDANRKPLDFNKIYFNTQTKQTCKVSRLEHGEGLTFIYKGPLISATGYFAEEESSKLVPLVQD